MLRLRDRLNPVEYRDVLIEKNLFNRHFADFNHRRWLYAPEATFEEFAEFIETFSRVLIKPVDGWEGEGIRAVNTSDLTVEGKKVLFKECQEARTMVEEIITNHPRMRFGNTSLNTLRVTSMLNGKGEPEIMSCVLRAGVGDSVVDNYCSGGVIYNVDVKEGIVDERGIRRDGRRDIVRHPGSNIIMLGYEIPRWDEVKEFVKKAHRHVPHLRFIGWDVAITPDHLELIEGNHDPDYELYSFIGPGGFWKRVKERL